MLLCCTLAGFLPTYVYGRGTILPLLSLLPSIYTISLISDLCLSLFYRILPCAYIWAQTLYDTCNSTCNVINYSQNLPWFSSVISICSCHSNYITEFFLTQRLSLFGTTRLAGGFRKPKKAPRQPPRGLTCKFFVTAVCAPAARSCRALPYPSPLRSCHPRR